MGILIDYLKILPLYLLPRRWLSRLFYIFAQSEVVWFKNFVIQKFHDAYSVDLTEAERSEIGQYKHFNDFFTRRLRTDVRHFCTDGEIASPVDGKISQIGPIIDHQLVQVKGVHYSLQELLANQRGSQTYLHGHFATLYLSPKDYHRVHMPISGCLKFARFIPGDLFPVNPSSVRRVRDLFARNERLVCEFDTNIGPMAVIMVGALLVGSIATVWDGLITPPHGREYQFQGQREFQKGEELGWFNMGSTVILLFPSGSIQWAAQKRPESAIKLGESLGQLIRNQPDSTSDSSPNHFRIR